MRLNYFGVMAVMMGLLFSDVCAFGTEAVSSTTLVVGSAGMQGRRTSMEDVIDVHRFQGLQYFAVFDGHDGVNAAFVC